MKKEILKSKAMLITLASILLVSCGGGGGGGGSSNLPINPGNNKNLSQLKNEYAEARKKVLKLSQQIVEKKMGKLMVYTKEK